MPYKSRNPDPENAQKFVEFLQEVMDTKNLSARKLSIELNVSPTYLCGILRGEKIPSAPVCNQIAERLNIPKIAIFILAGWLAQEDVDDYAESATLQLMEAPREVKRQTLTDVLLVSSKNKGDQDAR